MFLIFDCPEDFFVRVVSKPFYYLIKDLLFILVFIFDLNNPIIDYFESTIL
jgi:hypothetical protein